MVLRKLAQSVRNRPARWAAAAVALYLLQKRRQAAAAAAAEAASLRTRSGLARVRGADLYFELWGAETNPRLLLIPGSMCDLRRAAYVQLLTTLARHFRVLAFDHRGMGQSSMDEEASHYSMAGYAEDARGLLQHVGWDRYADAVHAGGSSSARGVCHVIGLSFGGMVAQELALLHPRLLRGRALVLGCTSAGGSGGASLPLHELGKLSDFSFAYQFLRASDTALLKWYNSWLPILAGVVCALGGSAHHLDASRRRAYWNVCRLLQFEARRHHDTSTRLGTLRCRTLVCGGDRDVVASPQNLEALSARIPGSSLMMFHGGHTSFLTEDPRAFAAIFAFILGALNKAADREVAEIAAAEALAAAATTTAPAKRGHTRARTMPAVPSSPLDSPSERGPESPSRLVKNDRGVRITATDEELSTREFDRSTELSPLRE